MSAADVIEEIKKLPREEQERVRQFLLKAQAEAGGDGAQAEHASDGDFEKAADKVFTEHDSLFRRLAQ